MAEKQNSNNYAKTGQGLVSALSERFKMRSSSETRLPPVASSSSSSSSPSPLNQIPPHSSTASSGQKASTSKPPPPPPAVAGPKQFKKCKSATFQIDGHYYTIGLYSI